MNFYIKIFVLILINFNLLHANIEMEENSGTSKKVVNQIQFNLDSLNNAVKKLDKTPLYSNELNKLYSKYTEGINHNKTTKFKIGKVFHSEITCEGIKVTIEDIIPIMLEIAKNALKQIPSYALKQITGFDMTSPDGFAAFVVQIISAVVCAGYSVLVIVPEQVVEGTMDFLSRANDTAVVSADTNIGKEQGMGGAAIVNQTTLQGINTTAPVKTAAALTESASKSFSYKFNECMDAMKEMYTEVITAHIKDFTPYKLKRKKSFCEMAKNWEKKTPAKSFTIKSPIRFHSIKKKKDDDNEDFAEKVCNKNTFIKSCREKNGSTIEGFVKINEEAINKFISDKQKILVTSNRIPTMGYSDNILKTGIKIINIIDKCINNPEATVCKRISCEGVGSLDSHCQTNNPNIKPLRRTIIPFTFSYPNNSNFDYDKINSLLNKMRMKKYICLQTSVFSTKQKESFINEMINLADDSSIEEQKNSDAVIIFNKIFKKEFCEKQYEQQIAEYETFTRKKYRDLELELVRDNQKTQVTLSKVRNLKADFDKNADEMANYVDMCTWFSGNGSLKQDFTTVLYQDPATGKRSIKKVNLTDLETSLITKGQPSYPVYGVCNDEDCNEMSCVYDCKNFECQYISNSPFSNEELDNNNIKKDYTEYKKDIPENKKYGSIEKRKKTTIEEYIKSFEESRMQLYDKVYNAYHNYEEKFANKIILKMLKRQEVEDSWFLY